MYEFTELLEVAPNDTKYIAIVDAEGTRVHAFKLMNSEEGVINQ